MSEKRLTFLYEATKVVPKNECGTFIRCQLLSKCHSITTVNLPAQNFKASIICQGCGVELAEEPPRTILKKPPKPTKLIRKIKKMISKKKPLTTHLQSLYKSFNDKNNQQLITVCKLCHKRNIEKMKKPKLKNTSRSNNEIKTLPQSVKKKKKDLFSGLNKAAVLSLSQNNVKKKNKHNGDKSIQIITGKDLEQSSSNQNGKQNKKSSLDFIPLETTNRPNTSIFITKNVISEKRQVTLTNNNAKNKKKEKLKKSLQNKIHMGRIQKNEVLKKTEKDIHKKQQNLKNLANFLKEKPSKTTLLSDFLKNL